MSVLVVVSVVVAGAAVSVAVVVLSVVVVVVLVSVLVLDPPSGVVPPQAVRRAASPKLAAIIAIIWNFEVINLCRLLTRVYLLPGCSYCLPVVPHGADKLVITNLKRSQ